MATLLAIGYAAERIAAEAADDLERRALELGIDTESIATVRRDREGRIHVSTNHHPSSDGASWGMFWEFLFGSLFFVPVFGMAVGAGLGAVMTRIEQSDLDQGWRERVRDMLQPGSSTVFLVADPASVDGALDVVSRLGGTVLSCSLSEQAAHDLQQQLHGGPFAAWSRA